MEIPQCRLSKKADGMGMEPDELMKGEDDG